ncbi:MAG: MerR family transcriptional regulator [Trueperaceae bacterium]|nr:MerR family transcriptional regulator [Trueperaceae bacterium]
MPQPDDMPTETATPAGLMTIGAFSQATRLSLKALRLYDTLGLVTPARVDESTGYRYYAPEQVAAAELVFQLRQVDMPLATIAKVLSAGEGEAVRVVQDYRRSLEAEASMRRVLTERVISRLRQEVSMQYEVEVREVPEQMLLTLERSTSVDALDDVIAESAKALYRHIEALGAEAGPMTVIFHGHVSVDSDGPVEVCVPISAPIQPFGAARIRLEPAHGEAFVRVPRSRFDFPEILDAYDSVDAWLRINGKACTGSPREVYFSAWGVHAADDPACEVAYPFS